MITRRNGSKNAFRLFLSKYTNLALSNSGSFETISIMQFAVKSGSLQDNFSNTIFAIAE